jgi:hypothetical protein
MNADLVLLNFEKKFPLGSVVVTCGVAAKIEESGEEYHTWIAASLKRHAQGDWGEMGDEDKQTNDEALATGEARIFSAYEGKHGKIWIITEWDRSATTILFPEEY